MPRRAREQQAHHGWACQPDSVPQMAYNEQVEVSTVQGYQPYWSSDPSSAWNQNQWQSSGSTYPFGPTYEQQVHYSPQQQYFPPQQQYFPPHFSCQMPYSMQQAQFQPQHQQFQHPLPQKSSLEDTMNVFLKESKQARESQGEAIERITAQMQQVVESVSVMMQQNPTEQLPWQPHQAQDDTYLSDGESDEVDAHEDITFQRSTDADDYDQEKLTSPEALDDDDYLVEPIVLEDVDELCDQGLNDGAECLVEPVVVEYADELCLPDLTDGQGNGEEYSSVFGFPEITAKFFFSPDFYFIPSDSFLHNCSFIDATDSVADDHFLQGYDGDYLLVGPADVRDEDERIQAMEWLKLEKEFG